MQDTRYDTLHDHRDFPRQAVEAKVRVFSASSDPPVEAPAVITDLCLGGARLSTALELQLDQEISLTPFLEMKSDHDLFKRLRFKVVWQSAGDETKATSFENDWDFYGLSHCGSVPEILDSWLGHLLLRRHKTDDLIVERRQYRRIRLPQSNRYTVGAFLSHNQLSASFAILDLAPGGLLVQGDEGIPIGTHLSLNFKNGIMATDDGDSPAGSLLVYGTIIDSYTESETDTIFYRISFDPDSEIDEERLLEWALGQGGSIES